MFIPPPITQGDGPQLTTHGTQLLATPSNTCPVCEGGPATNEILAGVYIYEGFKLRGAGFMITHNPPKHGTMDFIVPPKGRETALTLSGTKRVNKTTSNSTANGFNLISLSALIR